MRNDDKIKYWFTTEKGVHVPVREGQSKEEALKERFSEPKFEKVGLLDGMGEHDEPPEERGRSRKKKKEQFFGESDFIEVDTDTFVNALAEAKATVDPKDAWRVSSPDSVVFDEEHPNAKKYTTPGGSTVAITPDGDIVALCRNENDSLHGWQLIKFAAKNGGIKLDSFSGNHDFYARIRKDKWLEQNIKNGDVYALEFGYSGKNYGHVVIVQRMVVKSGKKDVRIYDPQNDRLYNNLRSYLAETRDLKLTNLTNCKIDENFCDRIMIRSNKK